ncbi:hypothetical protein, partial [Serratia marcescens]|uniref:hypothetical protein n=1 Tax=Serratia marcescens TaxID=615 RepID=UPI00165338A1
TIHQQLSKKYENLLDGLDSLATARSKDLLIIHCSTYFSIRILPLISSWVDQFAPGCKVVHRDFMRNQDTSEDLLLLRGVDLVFDVLPVYNFSLKTHVLFSEQSIFICRRDHPRLGSHLSMEEAKLERFSLFDSNGLDIQLGQVNINSQMGDRNFGFTSGSMLTIG